MEGRIYGDVPSEGSVSGRRFGIYRSYSPDPKLYSGTCIRVLFVFAVAAAVVFAIFYPVITYTSRGSRRFTPIPVPEIVNRSLGGGVRFTNSITINCSTSVFSFGNDCPETYKHLDDFITLNNKTDSYPIEIKIFEEENNLTKVDDEDQYQQDQADIADFKFQRRGRSRWPKLSTPYPYYLPQPTETPFLPTQEIQTSPQTNILAIPSDLGNGNSYHSSSSVNFTPPPYAFTPFPNFTDSYAQLSPYKLPKNNSNFIDVMKYLKHIGASDRSMDGDTLEDQPQGRSTTMKVKGTYMMPLDRRRPGEIIVSSPFGGMDDPNSFFNGHAYVSDPFTNFRPSNPSEVNRLIPVKTEMDLGPRFRRPVSFVPTSSITVDLTPPLPPRTEQLESVGSHTVAIFHPPPQISDFPNPPLIPRTTTEAPQDKPFSVTLDIYPVTMDNLPGSLSSSESTSTLAAPGQRVRPHPKWMRPKSLERPRWRPQPHKRPTPSASVQPTPDNHMVVHLNLFPSKRKSYVFPRRSRKEDTNEPEVLPNEQTVPTELPDQLPIEERTSNTMKANKSFSIRKQKEHKDKSSGRTISVDHPEFLALSSFGEVLENNSSLNSSIKSDSEEKETNTDINANLTDNTTLQPIAASKNLYLLNTEHTLIENSNNGPIVEDQVATSTGKAEVETTVPTGKEVETTVAVEAEVRTDSAVGEEVETVTSVKDEYTTALDTTDR